ncbi:pyridoxamine 5-phosphate oxidase [Rhodococcus pyridinivorans KG-16]|uniref:Pyridoxamine 5-phosphate oxidase n=1 Tax=Rhodococcus pyridinivorans KG-16 TaxID=1441730 RepID=A0A0V9UR51_9NOCA|nr:pyridoxamine 5'-phosphate oxidase family protein [Rhodococcus pyridinivorans]KSZ60484.1 pyridoxamine 5-phosphate oxidase [Rhodococcus pyridinivorans KG-16]
MSGNGTLRTRGAGISMTKEEIDLFLSAERTCRVATIGGDGSPHVAPLWFVWDGAFLWLNSVVRSRRWTDLQKDPRIAVVVDGGEQFTDLRGVEVRGTAVSVGDVPRGSRPEVMARTVEDELLRGVELSFARKYAGRDEFTTDGRHAWLRVIPHSVRSWDFGKIRRSR